MPDYNLSDKCNSIFSPVFDEIDKQLQEKDKIIITVEGRSAAGKTTFCELLKVVYDCTIFHMDDFFLRSEQRTEERYREVAGNIDYERFNTEVLVPLKNSEIVTYRKFDCSEMKLVEAECVVPGKLTVIEGVYSMHPYFKGYYDFSIFLDISSDLQKKRIISRNSPIMAEKFFNEWIPLEELYFETVKVKDKCKFVIEQT